MSLQYIPLVPKLQDLNQVETVQQEVQPVQMAPTVQNPAETIQLTPPPVPPSAPVLDPIVQPIPQTVEQPPAPKINIEISSETALVVGFGVTVLLLLYYIITLHRALKQSLNNTFYIKELYTATYVSEQIKEYIIAFNELNQVQGEAEKINARTQIFNFLNRISRQICETKDENLASKLADAFFSKIEGRYVKMSPVPESLAYFRFIAELLLSFDGTLEGQILLRQVRNGYKKGVMAQKRIVAVPKKEFGFNKSKNDNLAQV